ncbi:Pentatricopeptide repeat-containing protein, chloroplastic [Glycine soja]|uniref:Pentatricopeptide repeat-containing protein, chloroplastic n=1 Tax=Glycine soja TaxID=3848 RepID=A0A445H431_GLYSO|nr:Pentatricopeptide repeat-containing protein, chloroplastic [Glycine soja]
MTEGAFQVHAHMIKCGLVCDVFVGTSLLHFYGTFGWVAEVDKVFKEIEEPNIVSWTSLMVGYAYNGEGSKFEQFWDLLRGKSEYPSQKILREPESDPHLFSFHFSKVFPFKQKQRRTQKATIFINILILFTSAHSFLHLSVALLPKVISISFYVYLIFSN